MAGPNHVMSPRESGFDDHLEVTVPIGKIDWDDDPDAIIDEFQDVLELGLAAIEVNLREKFPDFDVRLLLGGRRMTPWDEP